MEDSSSKKLYHVFTDLPGSLTEIVDDSTNTVTKQSFDAWGNSRSVTDWRNTATYTLFADRGFTSHEHLEEFDLINMNGRVYDPVLGRFLSPDPYVQQPDFSQSLNRYSYCLNNPLIYTDPSGMRVLPGEWEWRYGERQNKPRYHDMDGGGSNPGYWYDSYSGEYRNKFGNIVSYDEVHYNYIIPNSEFTIYLSDILSESIITDPSVLPQSKEDYQKQADDYNNNEKLVETNDTKLKAMLNKIFNMSLGIFDLRVLTTNSGRYGMTSNLLYYNINNNTFVAGYTLPEDGGWGIHISPFALSNDVYFKAYGGHELIHLYHYFKTSFGEKYSEQTAYLYTYNVFVTNNYNDAANSAMNVAKSRGWWIEDPVKQRERKSDHAYIWVMGH